jgi:hypothetical protein
MSAGSGWPAWPETIGDVAPRGASTRRIRLDDHGPDCGRDDLLRALRTSAKAFLIVWR